MSKNKKLIYEQYQTINKEENFEDVVRRFQTKVQKNRQPDGLIHPSGIGDCPRYIYFFMNKVPFTNLIKHPPRTQRIFDVGNDHETRMKKNLKAVNRLVDVDVSIPHNSDRVSGTCDAIGILNNKYYVLEIKTANDYSYRSSIPHQNYKYQIAAYIIYLGIPQGKIWYQNKDNQEQVEVLITEQDSCIQETKNLIQFYNYNFDNKILPDVTNIRPSCSATSCKYWTECNKYPLQAIQQQ